MAKKRGLGKSLDALLGGASSQHEKSTRALESAPLQGAENFSAEDDLPAASNSPVSSTAGADLTLAANSERLLQLPVEKIRRGSYQPRRQFDQEALQELAESLKSQGLIQPILVRPFADGYEIIAGERRWRAAQLAGMQKIPAIVRELDDQSVAAVSLIENIQRKDLNPMDEARGLQRLHTEFAMTHQAVAEAVGRSRVAVSNLMRLLELDDEVKVLVDRGDLDMGHARALLGAQPDRQFPLAQQVIKKGLSVRATEQLVKADQQSDPVKPSQARRDPNIVTLEKRLSDTLGASVSINHSESGKGKLEISYTSLDELDGILAHIDKQS